LWVLGPRDRITQASVDRIEPGMAGDEVEQVLGRPADSKRMVGQPVVLGSVDGPRRRVRQSWRHVWDGPAGTVVVLMDDAGRVISAGYFDTSAPRTRPSSPLARLRAWLGW
jgi:hypothetical protein